jgi:hypothetical protein
MSFISDLFTSLTTDPSLSALIGTRLYPNDAPQDPVLPFIVYYEFANPCDQAMTGQIAVNKPRVQYSIYAGSYVDAMAVADALRPALLATGELVVFEDERGNNEATTGMHRRDIDVRFSYA